MRLTIKQYPCNPVLNYSLLPNQNTTHFLSVEYRLRGTKNEIFKLHNPKSHSCISLVANIKRKINGKRERERWPVVCNSSAATCRVKLETLNGCKLGIGRYPDFEYNAQGGGGEGFVVGENLGDGRVDVKFDVQSLYIPSLTYQTTRFLGLPLPPFLSIGIVPNTLQGFVDQNTGKVELNFRASFYFSTLSLFKPPPLLVETVLTTEEVKGELRNGEGQRLNSEGYCNLVGVATVAPINNSFLNAFLNLPTECLADMSAKILLKT